LFVFFLGVPVLGNHYEQWRWWSRLGAWVWLPVQAATVLFFVWLENRLVPVGNTNRD
jgi:hypothetical protein